MKVFCPLCESSKISTIKKFSIPSLQNEWVTCFGFDPFVNFYQQDQELTQHRCVVCDLEFYSPMYAGESDFYEQLSKNSWYYEENKWEFDEAIHRLSANKNIETLLEIGCGAGFFLEKVTNYYKTHGIELNQNAVKICEAKKIDILPENLENIERKFDAIVSFEVLEHLPNPKFILQRICELLSPGGILILAVPNPSSYIKEFDHILLDMPPHHVTRWSQKTFEYITTQFSIQLVGISNEPLRYDHYQSYLGMLASKNYNTLDSSKGRSIKQKIKQNIRDLIMPIISEIIIPQGYQYHKQVLLGQTHLVEYRKL